MKELGSRVGAPKAPIFVFRGWLRNCVWLILLGGLDLCLMRAAESTHLRQTGTFMHHPSIDIELLVAEPAIVDPVALTFDARNRMYVVEMRDYPYGGNGTSGTIRLLKFGDDWQLEKATVFAEGLSFPTSVAAWNDGVFVTAPPQILYLKDTDGDGQADVREVVFDGFRLGVTDSNVNGLRWGLDNRIHGANGGNDGRVSRRSNDEEIDVRDADFAFSPRNFSFERTLHSASGFGLVFNEIGDSFSTYNIEHIQQRVIPLRYLESLPPGLSEWGTVDISDHGPAGRIFPVSDSETRVNHPEQAGHFSAAGGMGYVSNAYFGEQLGNSVLVCDVVGNLVHRDVLVRSGSIWRATRAHEEQEAEFIASFDLAFRPVGVETGPDGALYLIDMQRRVIEHPDYIPAVVKQKVDLREGENRGRIYRITPATGIKSQQFSLADAPNRTLVAQLNHENSWVRNTAQRLLIERSASGVTDLLRSLLMQGSRFGRLHAMWTLHGLGELTRSDLRNLLQDEDVGVRRNALLVLEQRGVFQEEQLEMLFSLIEDADLSVQRQAVLTLGQVVGGDKAKNTEVLSRVIRRDEGVSKWLSVAVLCSLGAELNPVVLSLLQDKAWLSKLPVDQVDLLRRLVTALVQGAASEPRDVIEAVAGLMESDLVSDDILAGLLAGINDGLESLNKDLPSLEKLSGRFDRGRVSESMRLRFESCRFARELGGLEDIELGEQLEWATVVILNDSLSFEERSAAVDLFRLGSYEQVSEELWRTFFACHSEGIQRSFCSVLRSFQDVRLANQLLNHWRQVLPRARPEVTKLLLRRRLYHEPLIAALENQSIGLGELNLDLEQRRRLRRSSHPDLMKRASVLFGDEEYSHRSAEVVKVLETLPRSGDRERGKMLFVTHCSPCHQWGNEGHAVGPPLSSLSHRSVEDLISNILDPNMAINPRYATVDVDLVDDETVSGILRRQDQTALTIGLAQGLEERIPRSRIQSFRYSKHSLMPSGWEALMTPQQLRDLVALLRDEAVSTAAP